MMGLFEQWPYVNFHDLNLDWIIKKIKNVETAEANSQASAAEAAESAAASQLSADAAMASQEAAHNSAESISDKAEQIDINTARLDNIIADGQQTEGNTELIDIRVAASGKIYDLAGNAVRGQHDELTSVIGYKYTDYNRNVTGNIISQTSRWFIGDYISESIPVHVFVRTKAENNVKIEYWLKNENTLTKVAEETKTGVINNFIQFDAPELDIGDYMVSIIADYDTVTSTIDTNTEYIGRFSRDLDSDTLSYSTLSTYPGMSVNAFIEYIDGGYLKTFLADMLADVVHDTEIVTVKQDGTGDFTTISEAVSQSPENSSIIIYPGVYTESIEAWGKTISLIGIDKKECVIKNTTGNYSTPALEIDSGIVCNLTLISDASSPTCDSSDTTNYMKDYTIHVEHIHATDKELLIENCIIKNTHRAALGIGLYDHNTVTVRNCEIWAGKPPEDIYQPVWNKRGAVFFHNRQPSAYFSNITQQVIRFIDNTVYCEDIIALFIGDSTAGIDMQAQGWINEMECQFINNMFCAKHADGSYKISSNGITTAPDFVNDSIIGGYPFSDNLENAIISYGNNLDYLNN